MRLLFVLIATTILVFPTGVPAKSGPITGSTGCRSCHVPFYKLWSTSFHGLAMRPYSDAFAKASLIPQDQAIAVGASRYRAFTGPAQGWVEERTERGVRRYRITHVLGGKNVFYFLTLLDKGRLQTLPMAYDVRRKEWFDMAGSGIRHVQGTSSAPLDWREWPYTFNTACHGCHVSQLSTNYDPKTDTYRTTWTEPGINCETCHGPGREHVEVCLAAPKGKPPKALKTIRGGRDFTHAQNNEQCSTCHAKAVPLTPSYPPGERFFDHFDLVAYENPDYYPDGRDLGENYTYTSWLRSPCARSGQLDCLHCHTSSGRYRFTDPARANDACLPCHAQRVAQAPEHTRHKADSPGNRCVSCHMPMTEFARMRRSDHSMLPPTPASTLAYESPNACNACHRDKDAAWADRQVRSWHVRDYQAPVLDAAGLIQAARTGDWTRLPDMLAYLTREDADEIVSTALVRLSRACPDQGKWEAILAALSTPSPLVRAAAAEALGDLPSRQAVRALVLATGDTVRLVRVRAAQTLSGVPRSALGLSGDDISRLDAATAEYLAALSARPDQWTSQYNLGNYHLAQGDAQSALECFGKASRLDPLSVPPLVNAAMANARLGHTDKAAASLEKALTLDPRAGAAHFNLGLLQAERGDPASAEAHLRAALASDPGMHEAAYNLGVLLGRDHPADAVEFCSKAHALRPDIPKYATTLAVFLFKAGDAARAERVLTAFLESHPDNREAARLLAQIRKQSP